MMRFPLYKRIPVRALHGSVTFFAGYLSSVVLIQIADVKTPAGNGHGRSDFFPLTHWSVVVAAGESQAEPEIAQKAFAELCQTYWAPLCSFVRRGYAMEDTQDLTQSFFAYLIEHKIYARADRTKELHWLLSPPQRSRRS